MISPIHKKGSKAVPENYRPISLTSHVIKVFERIVRDKLVHYLETNHLICHNQHGFRKGRSCLSELLIHFDDILSNRNEGKDTDAIYLDFEKAFDKVDHDLLLKKLTSYGIKGKLHTWIKAFLLNRTQVVAVDGVKSYPTVVISGVPQGTVLGPILFLIFINDINTCIEHSTIRFFADDTRLIKAIDTIEDVNKLQHDLDEVTKWSDKNNMKLHQNKSELLQHIFNPDAKLMKELPFVQYETGYKTVDGSLIEPSTHVRDLGVTITHDLSWSHHINKIADKGRQAAAWVLGVFKARDSHTMMVLYKSLVRSHIEYCCPLWNPTLCRDIQTIEEIQRIFVRKINHLEGPHYWERLINLNLMSLQRRRERYIIIYMFKILKNLSPNDLQVSWYYNDRLGLKAITPPKGKGKVSIHESSFSIAGPKLWNILPKHVTLQPTLSTFKSSLGEFLNHFPDTPPVKGYSPINSNSLIDWVRQKATAKLLGGQRLAC